jgi:hypothetical protein
MPTLIVLNSIAALVVVAGLGAAARLGYVTAGGRFDRARGRLELRRGIEMYRDGEQRRAA